MKVYVLKLNDSVIGVFSSIEKGVECVENTFCPEFNRRNEDDMEWDSDSKDYYRVIVLEEHIIDDTTTVIMYQNY